MAYRYLVITENEAGQRADRFLRMLLPDFTRGEIFKWLRTKRVKLNGGKAAPETRLERGDQITVWSPGPADDSTQDATATPVHRGLQPSVVEARPELLIVDKPSGMLVHPGNEGEEAGTVVAWVKAHLAAAGQLPHSPTFWPAPVHRLDAGTSGLIVVAKTLPASRAWSAALVERRLHESYLAWVEGPIDDSGRIEVPLRRRPDGPGVVVGEGDPALTEYRVLERRGERSGGRSSGGRSSGGRSSGGRSLVELTPITGRRHQLRAHLAHVGAPIIGDTRYGGPPAERLMLHAHELSGPDPMGGPDPMNPVELAWRSVPPADFSG